MVQEILWLQRDVENVITATLDSKTELWALKRHNHNLKVTSSPLSIGTVTD